jgi:hypothetical protein
MLTHHHSHRARIGREQSYQRTAACGKGPSSIDSEPPFPNHIALMIDLLTIGALQRAGLAACVIALLWLAVAWAIG